MILTHRSIFNKWCILCPEFYYIKSQQILICSKSIIETLEKVAKCVCSHWYRFAVAIFNPEHISYYFVVNVDFVQGNVCM